MSKTPTSCLRIAHESNESSVRRELQEVAGEIDTATGESPEEDRHRRSQRAPESKTWSWSSSLKAGVQLTVSGRSKR